MFKVLLCLLITLSNIDYSIQATSEEIRTKFISDEIVPDVLDDLPEVMNTLKVTYSSDLNVTLGNVLKPSQVANEPRVEWDADDGVIYTLLMTGILKVERF